MTTIEKRHGHMAMFIRLVVQSLQIATGSSTSDHDWYGVAHSSAMRERSLPRSTPVASTKDLIFSPASPEK